MRPPHVSHRKRRHPVALRPHSLQQVRDIGINTDSSAVSETLDPNRLDSEHGASGTTCPE